MPCGVQQAGLRGLWRISNGDDSRVVGNSLCHLPTALHHLECADMPSYISRTSCMEYNVCSHTTWPWSDWFSVSAGFVLSTSVLMQAMENPMKQPGCDQAQAGM
jgi:hypothetical protein